MHSSRNAADSAELTFFIDGQEVDMPALGPDDTPSASSAYRYNCLWFSMTSLPNEEHTLVLQSGKNKPNSSLVLFDYLVYTV